MNKSSTSSNVLLPLPDTLDPDIFIGPDSLRQLAARVTDQLHLQYHDRIKRMKSLVSGQLYFRPSDMHFNLSAWSDVNPLKPNRDMFQYQGS